MAPEGGRCKLSWCLNSAISFQKGGGCFTGAADNGVDVTGGCWAKEKFTISKDRQQVRRKVRRKPVLFITTFCQIYGKKLRPPRRTISEFLHFCQGTLWIFAFNEDPDHRRPAGTVR